MGDGSTGLRTSPIPDNRIHAVRRNSESQIALIAQPGFALQAGHRRRSAQPVFSDLPLDTGEPGASDVKISVSPPAKIDLPHKRRHHPTLTLVRVRVFLQHVALPQPLKTRPA